MARRREEHNLPGEIIMLRGLAKRTAGRIANSSSGSDLQGFVKKITDLDDEVVACKCWTPYRSTLMHAIQYHIAHLEADPEDRQKLVSRGHEMLIERMKKLNECLVQCKVRKR